MQVLEPSSVRMTAWLTAAEIEARYMVSEQTLLNYSHRGNLAFRRAPDGAMRFDERGVARLFRRRDGRSANLGVLGATHLGEPARPPVRSERARSERAAVSRRSSWLASSDRIPPPSIR